MPKRFYEQTRQERLVYLAEQGLITAAEQELLQKNFPLSDEYANHLIENQVAQVHLPLGLAFNFVIDGRARIVPMATEEPSVIAACSFGAKLIQQAGGFQTKSTERLMIGQIVFNDVGNPAKLLQTLAHEEQAILRVAHESYPSIVKRGGGTQSVQYKKQQMNPQSTSFVTVELLIDVKDAMGANIVNAILEGVGAYLQTKVNEEVLLKILSNYADHSLVTATCKVHTRDLARGIAGEGNKIARRIVAATDYANLDIYRATTHNKGIMNGIDAVVLATGNDFRAIEAGCHAYASRKGTYQALTQWTLNEEAETLIGELTVPMPIAIVGGATSILPQATFTQKISQSESASDLAKMIVAVGLAQNLAALRALVSEGIQKGHMNLQAKTLAATVGATDIEVPKLIAKMKEKPTMNQEVAQLLLQELRMENNQS